MRKVNYYIVRHGETLLNKLGKAQGWVDSPLTDAGIEQHNGSKRNWKGFHLLRYTQAICKEHIRRQKLFLKKLTTYK